MYDITEDFRALAFKADDASHRRTRQIPLDAARGLRRWWPLVLLGAAQFMLIIDVTVVMSRSSIGRDLDLDRAMTWVAIAYTLLFGLSSSVGDWPTRSADGGSSSPRPDPVHGGLGRSGLTPDGNLLIISRALQDRRRHDVAGRLSMSYDLQGPATARALGVWAALGGGAAFGVVLGSLLAAGPGCNGSFRERAGQDRRRHRGWPDHPRPRPGSRGGRIDLPGVLLIVGDRLRCSVRRRRDAGGCRRRSSRRPRTVLLAPSSGAAVPRHRSCSRMLRDRTLSAD
jgi:hypothetical protein